MSPNEEPRGGGLSPLRVVLIIGVIVAAIAFLVVALSGGEKEKKASAQVTVPVDGLDPGKAPDHNIVVPKVTVKITAKNLGDTELKDETPTKAPADELKAAQKKAQEIRKTEEPLPTAGATAGFAGCRTGFVNNQSSRRGVRPQEQVLHYTVSPNVNGWADVNSVNALFDRSSSQASSNFIIDTEGHCAYIVPIEAKAWTQAAGNPFSVSYEIIATGRESRYLSPPGMTKLRSVMKEVSRRTGIPMRPGHVRNCVPTRTGIIQHKDWTLCGGGHVDISPFPINQVVSQILAGGVTHIDTATCRKINAWRKAGRPKGGAWEKNSIWRKSALTKRHVNCTTHGAVKS